jgi:hypothetical protein
MKVLHRILVVLAASGLLAMPALAAKPAPSEPVSDVSESEIGGEAWIHMKLEFVKFTLDGKEWENYDYEDARKTLVIRGVDRNSEHTVLLTPRESGWEPYTLVLKPGEFKRTNISQKGKTTTIAFRAKHVVDFTKALPPKPADPAKPAESPK